jgi:hypothetical protein
VRPRRSARMTASGVDEATAPARWLLDAAAGGVALTQTNALARAVVREAAERWPDWWDAELFGAPHREADLAVLSALHEGLRRLRLVRRRGRRLHATARGRELSQDPATLLTVLATDLGAGDPFTEAVAAAVTATLAAGDHSSHDDLGATALARVRRGGWNDSDGRPPTERDISWVVGDVVCRGEAYGLIHRHPDPTQRRLRAQVTACAVGSVGASSWGARGCGEAADGACAARRFIALDKARPDCVFSARHRGVVVRDVVEVLAKRPGGDLQPQAEIDADGAVAVLIDGVRRDISLSY